MEIRVMLFELENLTSFDYCFKVFIHRGDYALFNSYVNIFMTRLPVF